MGRWIPLETLRNLSKFLRKSIFSALRNPLPSFPVNFVMDYPSSHCSFQSLVDKNNKNNNKNNNRTNKNNDINWLNLNQCSNRSLLYHMTNAFRNHDMHQIHQISSIKTTFYYQQSWQLMVSTNWITLILQKESFFQIYSWWTRQLHYIFNQ